MELLSNAIITFLYQAFLIEQVLNSLGRKQNQVLPPNFRQFWSHVKRSDPISCFCNHHHQEYISKFSQNSMKSQKLNKFGLWNFNQIHFAWWNSNEICFEWWNQYEMIVPKLQEYARIDVRSLKFWILKLVLLSDNSILSFFQIILELNPGTFLPSIQRSYYIFNLLWKGQGLQGC